MGIGGLGIGDWGLGIGDWAQSPIPNPQSPIPNPQSPRLYIRHFKNSFNFFCHNFSKIFIILLKFISSYIFKKINFIFN
jgi:hypothetical protein